MKYFLFLLLLFLPKLSFAQIRKMSFGFNPVPLILNRTVDFVSEYRKDSMNAFTVNLGGTIFNKQNYALCIQCADRPRIVNLNAISLKTNYRRYYKKKSKSKKFFAVGGVLGYYEKDYKTELLPPNFPVRQLFLNRKRFVFSPNLQLGRSIALDSYTNLDFGTQFNFPMKYQSSEPEHYTPTRGMGIINFFLVFKFKKNAK